ncbi:MAG: T9SS type A sorting domain-containing protein [Bacteroidales bacterium]|nr:T9SS type A sorting domain-containing protein [Bacteroidales bacterium]
MDLNDLKNSDFTFSIYPNPFTNRLNLHYSLNEANYVEIKLIDITGRLITTLINSYLNPGEYIIEIDGNNCV